jgi:acetyl esterase/lipase
VGLLNGLDDPQDDLSVSCAPTAMILFNPAVDLTREGLGRAPDEERYNDLITRLGAEISDLSPTEHVKPGLPPCIIFHGTADPTVPYAQEIAFRDKMLAAGNRCELVGYDGYEHGFFNANRDDKRPYFDTLRRTDEFLASLGYLTGSPTVRAEE